MKISHTPFFIFLNQHYLLTLPTAPYLWEEKSEPRPLVSPYKQGGGPTML